MAIILQDEQGRLYVAGPPETWTDDPDQATRYTRDQVDDPWQAGAIIARLKLEVIEEADDEPEPEPPAQVPPAAPEPPAPTNAKEWHIGQAITKGTKEAPIGPPTIDPPDQPASFADEVQADEWAQAHGLKDYDIWRFDPSISLLIAIAPSAQRPLTAMH